MDQCIFGYEIIGGGDETLCLRSDKALKLAIFLGFVCGECM